MNAGFATKFNAVRNATTSVDVIQEHFTYRTVQWLVIADEPDSLSL